jgi:hypothetical protein
VAALASGERAALRCALQTPDAASLAYQASVFQPSESTRVRRLAGGAVAADESKLTNFLSLDEQALDPTAAAAPAAKAKPPPGPTDDVLVFDHHGDLLDGPTKQAYMCKHYTLHYEVERVLPPNRPLDNPGNKR